MARINLLPWRKEQRERRNKEFNLLAGAVAGLAILATILALSLLNRDLSNQQEANKHIENANAQLDVALKSIEELEAQREQMLSQMKVIQDLQGRRSVPVRVWDDIARAIPEAMYLNNIKREADVITLKGFADNPNVVATLVRNLNASDWLDGSAVVSIKSKIEAYQETIVQPTTNNSDRPARPVYPEDSYIEFEVTTKVQNPQTAEEAQAQANATNDQNVVLPPVTVTTAPQSSNPTALPDVAPIGVENAPVANSAPPTNTTVTPESTTTTDGTTPTQPSESAPNNSQTPTAANSSTQAGGQQ